MKKIILLPAFLIISASFTFSQSNTFPTSGNVGIGTISPASKMHVVGGKIYIGTPTVTDNYDLLISAGSDPGFRQEVQRSSGGAAFDLFNVYAHKTSATGDALWGKIGVLGTFGASGINAIPTLNYMYFGTEINVSYLNNTFRLYPNKVAYFEGNVGIGTTAPAVALDISGTTYSRQMYIGIPDANTLGNMAGNKLAVNGTAVFVKAKVAIYGPTTWPDYVFDPSYKMTALDSLEQFIQLNKHLPEMPTATDVERDGLDLGDNQTLLLKKIEELTLIVIDQNKRIEGLERNKMNCY